MQKKSFNNAPEKELKPVKNLPISNPESDKNYGNRGYIINFSETDPSIVKEEDLEDFYPELKEKLKAISSSKDIYNFIMLKIASTQSADYSKSLNELISVIKKSDILDSENLIENLILKYNDYISKNVQPSIAFSNIKSIADKYLQLNKKAQMEANPPYVGAQLANIIKIMLSSISIASRPKSYANLRQKINQLNISEMSQKVNKGGAPIGVSISLVKNLLNGKSPHFIAAVLRELNRRI